MPQKSKYFLGSFLVILFLLLVPTQLKAEEEISVSDENSEEVEEVIEPEVEQNKTDLKELETSDQTTQSEEERQKEVERNQQEVQSDNNNVDLGEEVGDSLARFEESLQQSASIENNEEFQQILSKQTDFINSSKEDLEKVTARSKWQKFFLGPDYRGIKKIKEAIENNKQLVSQLKSLQETILDENSKAEIQTVITSMEEVQTSFQNKVSESEKTGFSLFGWLIKMFVK